MIICIHSIVSLTAALSIFSLFFRMCFLTHLPLSFSCHLFSPPIPLFFHLLYPQPSSLCLSFLSPFLSSAPFFSSILFLFPNFTKIKYSLSTFLSITNHSYIHFPTIFDLIGFLCVISFNRIYSFLFDYIYSIN